MILEIIFDSKKFQLDLKLRKFYGFNRKNRYCTRTYYVINLSKFLLKTH